MGEGGNEVWGNGLENIMRMDGERGSLQDPSYIRL